MLHYEIVFHCLCVCVCCFFSYYYTVFLLVNVFISWRSQSCSLFFCIYFAFTLIVADSFFSVLHVQLYRNKYTLCRICPGIVLLLFAIVVYLSRLSNVQLLQSQNRSQNNAKYHRENVDLITFN